MDTYRIIESLALIDPCGKLFLFAHFEREGTRWLYLEPEWQRLCLKEGIQAPPDAYRHPMAFDKGVSPERVPVVGAGPVPFTVCIKAQALYDAFVNRFGDGSHIPADCDGILAILQGILGQDPTGSLPEP